MKDTREAPDGFLARWSRRKASVKVGEVPPEAVPEPAMATVVEAPAAPTPEATAAVDERPAPPTLDDAAQLTPASDFRRFVAPDVSPEVKNAALKKLFADPQFNVMDGLDTYIDDYGRPDPIPPAMLRQMVQSKFLGLFDDEEDDKKSQPAGAIPDGAAPSAEAQSSPEPLLPIADDQDPALRLQPLDAAGPPRDPGRAGEDTGRER